MNLKKYVDYKLFFAVFALVIFWMIMISSVSVYSSYRVTSLMVKSWLIKEAYNYFYVIRNITHVITSSLILLVVVKIPYTYFEKYARYILWAAVLLLITVLIIWPSWNGAKWWITLPWIPFTIQPVEFIKLALIVYIAYFLKKNHHKIHTFSDGFIPFIVMLWAVVWIIWLLPDFWTILVIVPLSFIMFFIWWANPRHLIAMILIWFLFATSIYEFWKYDKSVPTSRNKLSYITDRIDNFLANNKEAIKNRTINYQTEQALIAIGSGGFWWLGFWQSIQKFWYLPEVQGDYIFSVIVEELGFVGAFTLLSFFLYIGYRWLTISQKVSDPFAKYFAIWFSSRILLQAFINIWVNLNIVPLTGITLPFISYGGSSLLALMIWLWILLNISRYMEDKKESKSSRKKKFLYMFSRS